MARKASLLNLRFGDAPPIPADSTMRMPLDQKPIRLQIQLRDCPDEVISNIVRRMEDPSSVCFALTAHKHYDIVMDVKRQSLGSLCPPLRGDFYVSVDGSAEHEQFIAQLWDWLGKRCVFCGVAEEKLMVIKEQKLVYSGHVCDGWLAQLDQEESEKNIWECFDRKLKFQSAKPVFNGATTEALLQRELRRFMHEAVRELIAYSKARERTDEEENQGSA